MSRIGQDETLVIMYVKNRTRRDTSDNECEE
jgi:hypothetical protein